MADSKQAPLDAEAAAKAAFASVQNQPFPNNYSFKSVPNDHQTTATHLSLSPMSRDRKRPGCRGASGPLLAT